MIGHPERAVLASDPACETEDDAMEFRLTYEGILLGASRDNKRAKHKHEIRKIFHKQLRRLVELHPIFEWYTMLPKIGQGGWVPPLNLMAKKREYEEFLDRYDRSGYKFFPIATRDLSLLCSVEIMFLRPDVPGAVLRSGDIDNRLKTIFDALRMPRDKSELGGYVPDDDEIPFFCLLEDDSLINRAAVEADTLLQPTGSDWDNNDARLIITIRLSPYRLMDRNIGFA
jgi:hypothetical protein